MYAGCWSGRNREVKVFLITDGGLHHHLAASGNFGQVIRKNYPVIVGNKVSGNARETVSVVGPLMHTAGSSRGSDGNEQCGSRRPDCRFSIRRLWAYREPDGISQSSSPG